MPLDHTCPYNYVSVSSTGLICSSWEDTRLAINVLQHDTFYSTSLYTQALTDEQLTALTTYWFNTAKTNHALRYLPGTLGSLWVSDPAAPCSVNR